MTVKFSDKICFIVPSFNSEKTIEKCLISIKKQKMVKKEIILVDGGSNDSTLIIAKKIGGIKTFIEKKRGPAAARNFGLKKTDARYIAFVDSDCIIPNEWVKKCMKIIKNKEIAGVGGPGISTKKTIISESLDLLLYKKCKDRCFVNSIATMNAFYDRKKIGKLKFNDNLIMAEDPEFNFRIIKSGYKLFFDQNLFVYHNHPTTITEIIKKWYNYGKYYPLPYLMHKEMIDKDFVFRMVYTPLLIFFIALSPFYYNFIGLVIVQLVSLFILYLLIGIKKRKSFNVFIFSFVHSIKQIAQGFGIIRGFLGGR